METSIVTKHGVNEVFENAIKAALIQRRQTRPLFSSYLKYVEEPAIQKPYLPERNPEPDINVCSKSQWNYQVLLGQKALSDVTFLVDHEVIYAHSVPLMMSSCIFQHLFSHPKLLKNFRYTAPISFSSFSNSIVTTNGYINGTNEFYLPRGYHTIDVISNPLNLRNIYIKVKNVDSYNFRLVLEYLYTGNIASISDSMQLFNVASFLQENSVLNYLSNFANNQDLSSTVLTKFIDAKIETSQTLLQQSFYADVAFVIEGSIIPAHKHVLVSQCAMMAAMFKQGVFKESLMEQVCLHIIYFIYFPFLA